MKPIFATKRFILPPLLAAALLTGAPVRAEVLAPAQQVVQTTADILQKELRRDEYRQDFAKAAQFVDRTIESSVDFDRLAALALGKHWKTATAQQKERFRREFRSLLVRTYATAFVEYARWKIRYLPQQTGDEGGKTLVRTEILPEGAQPVAVDYRLSNTAGKWMVYDVLIDGVSLLQTHRTTFSQEIAQTGSLDGVIDRIAKRNSGALKEPLKPGAKTGA